ncbi:MAG: hypothetical protein IPL96_05120 [Holophagaceae bacterium]|nr:hypothetical protein [Holophagaceae bacterium]
MDRIDELQARLQALEAELMGEVDALREARGYHLEGRRVVIAKAIRKAQRLHRKRVARWLMESRLLAWLVVPVIWGGILPGLLMDAFCTVYQWICFPIYGIPKVRRGDYIVVDRGKLPYLNWMEKLGCLYCSYFNGMVAYVQEIAARTEQHYCPIKHARRPKVLHDRYRRFFDYGDAEAYKARLEALRTDFADLRPKAGPRL